MSEASPKSEPEQDPVSDSSRDPSEAADKRSPKRRAEGSRTRAFGAGSRISHDASVYYSSRLNEGLEAADQPTHKGETPLPQDVTNRIIVGSSEQMTGVPDNSVHLVVTSPPYNATKEYDDDLSLREYLDFLRRVFAECYRVLVDGGRACVNVANLGRKPYIPLSDHISRLMIEDLGYTMRGEIIWAKGAGAGVSMAWGSWRSASNPVLRDTHEYILVFSKGARKRSSAGRQSTIARDDFMQWTKSVWQMKTESARRVKHPAPFPVELPRRLIQLYTFAGDVVLDPFMGSGATAIAALEAGRRYTGYELNPDYAQIAEERIAKIPARQYPRSPVMKKNEPKNFLVGTMPKIGIRPAIDGRQGGVRESLEEKTMAMAQSVADFLSSNLRHYNGLPVECVIADSTIGGVAEAAACADKFARENVGVSITVTPCWCYGSETMDMDTIIPKAVWGFNGTERPGAVYLAAVAAAHAQKGLPVFKVYGRDVQDLDDNSIPADVQEKLLQFARAAIAVADIRGKSYLAMGGVSMGIGGSIVDQPLLEETFGMRVETIDMTEFIRRMERNIYDPEEYERALAWTKEKCVEGKDYNAPDKQQSRDEKDEVWETCVKMAIIARDLMIGNPKLKEMGYLEEAKGHNAIASGFQGQRQWTDHMPNGDFMEAILNSSFDWNGIRAPHLVATENDVLNGLSMLLGHAMTGSAQLFADVRTYWSPDAVKRVTGYQVEGAAAGGFLHLINSGSATLDATGQQTRDGEPVMKPWWEVTDEEAEACLANTTWHAGSLGYFRGGGWSSKFLTRGEMPVTMVRINMVKGLGPALQIAEGWAIDLPEEVNRTLDERTDPTWPTTWFAPRVTGEGPFRDAYTVMENWGANHGSISYGHTGADFITLASMLRIPVYMHNVPEEKVFRPAVWSTFGANEPMGADFRACASFGPVYK